MDKALQIQIAVIVFILFLCILCFFAVMIVLRDIVSENSKNRKELKELKEQAKQKEEVKEEVMVPEQKEENTEDVKKTNDDSVIFSSHILSMPDRYATLSNEYKAYFDDIVRYVLTKKNAKEYKHNSYYTYKDASYRILRITIKRGEISCELYFVDREIKDYVEGSNVPVKQSATTIKINGAAAVGVVKDGIDLVCSQIASYKDYKKQLAREKRKEKNAKKKQALENADETVNI